MSRIAVGVDIGGTAVKLGLVESGGRIIARKEIATPTTAAPPAGLALIARAIDDLVRGDLPEVIGVGCAGLVDSRRGMLHNSPNLPKWRHAPLGQQLRELLGRPVHLLNDATAFVAAEAHLGAGRCFSPVVGLTLGTGVGGGLVFDGRVAGGHRGYAGEIGHMSVDHAGPRCACGNSGCLEQYVGRRAIVADYRRRASWEPGSIAFDLAQGDAAALDPQLLARGARQGDSHARGAFEFAGRMLGVALANLANLLDPAVFVIGGGLAQAGDLILAPAGREMRMRAMAAPEMLPEIRPAALGVDAGFVGAALHALETA